MEVDSIPLYTYIFCRIDKESDAPSLYPACHVVLAVCYRNSVQESPGLDINGPSPACFIFLCKMLHTLRKM